MRRRGRRLATRPHKSWLRNEVANSLYTHGCLKGLLFVFLGFYYFGVGSPSPEIRTCASAELRPYIKSSYCSQCQSQAWVKQEGDANHLYYHTVSLNNH